MATYNIDKITSPSGDVYKLQDKVSGFTTNTGTVTSVTAGTGLRINSLNAGGSITGTGTINHINSVTAGTAGTSSATSGSTLAVPYITYDAQGHITATGTHTHTITGFSTATNLVNGSATGSLRAVGTVADTSYSIGQNAFAEGSGTQAGGSASHAEGFATNAAGDYSHAEGYYTEASGKYSHASGVSTIANSNYQTVVGMNNIPDTPNSSGDGNYLFVVGNGTTPADDDRSNAFGVLKDGNTVQFIDVEKGTAPSTQKYSEVRFKEKNGTVSDDTSDLAKFGVTADTNGSYRTYIRGYYPIANNSNSANITITTLSDGSNWIDLESWVNVLGGHLDICSAGAGILGFRYGGAASATATITNTSGSILVSNGNFLAGGNLSTNGKSSATEAKSGVFITTSGNMNLTGASSTGAKINFYYGLSTSATSVIQETSSGVLNISGEITVGNTTSSNARGVTVRNSLANITLHTAATGNHGIYSSTQNGWIIYCSNDTSDTLAYIPRSLSVNGTLYQPNKSHYIITNLTKGTTPSSDSGWTSVAWLEQNYSTTDNAGRFAAIRQYLSNAGVNYLQMQAFNPTADATDNAYFRVCASSTYKYAHTNTNFGVNKNSYNEAATGVFLGTNGNIYLTGASSSYIYFYYNKATSSTSYISESASGTITVNAYLRGKDAAGTIRQVIGTATGTTELVTYLATNATILSVNARHGASSGFTNKSLTFNTSDIRLKTNIVDSTVNALDVINKIRIREFDWTDEREDKHQVIGMVADEIEKLDKKFAVGGGYDEDGCMNIKSVDTFYLTGYLTKGMQELSKENEELKKRIKRLETTLSKISVS